MANEVKSAGLGATPGSAAAGRQRATPQGGYAILRYGHTRHWAITDAEGDLICLAVYLRGAREVVRRLEVAEATR